MKKIFILSLVCFINFSAYSNEVEVKAKDFIYQQQNSITKILLTSNKKEKFESLYNEIDKTFATQRIYKFVMARYAKLFNNEQKNIIIEYFKKMIVVTYGLQSSINVQNLSFKAHNTFSEKQPDGSIKITIEGTVDGTKEINLLKVSFVLIYEKDVYKIYDIKIENIGMLISFRNMFTKMIQEQNGDPETLVNMLQNDIDKINHEILGTPLPKKEEEEIIILQ